MGDTQILYKIKFRLSTIFNVSISYRLFIKLILTSLNYIQAKNGIILLMHAMTEN
jgi:hypothetical protein